MHYSYYPGCSLEATAIAYHKSLEAVADALGMELEEIPDWNCCGATVASGVVGDFTQQVMSSRNLAVAEAKGNDVLVACSSCYLTLAVTNKRFKEDEHFRKMANEALAAGGLKYNGTLKVRQVLEVMANDIGLDKIKARVTKPLTGLKVAGYVGCQTVRAIPWDFDDPEHPVFLDRLIEALGATPVYFPMKAKCCGSSHALAQPEIVLSSCRDILSSATEGGAQIAVTPCPMCQMNMDVYQSKVNKDLGTSFSLPILFFSQLMGVAFGLPPVSLGLKHSVVSPYQVLAPFGAGQ